MADQDKAVISILGYMKVEGKTPSGGDYIEAFPKDDDGNPVCGAFQNDPEVVARAYRTALDEFPKLFKKIEFAVYCPAVDTTNYSVFKRIFDES